MSTWLLMCGVGWEGGGWGGGGVVGIDKGGSILIHRTKAMASLAELVPV